MLISWLVGCLVGWWSLQKMDLQPITECMQLKAIAPIFASHILHQRNVVAFCERDNATNLLEELAVVLGDLNSMNKNRSWHVNVSNPFLKNWDFPRLSRLQGRSVFHHLTPGRSGKLMWGRSYYLQTRKDDPSRVYWKPLKNVKPYTWFRCAFGYA